MIFFIFFLEVIEYSAAEFEKVLIRLFVMVLRRSDPLKMQLSGWNNAEKTTAARVCYYHSQALNMDY